MTPMRKIVSVSLNFLAIVIGLFIVLAASLFFGFKHAEAEAATYRNGKYQSTAQYTVKGRNDTLSYPGIPGGQTARYNRPHINQPSTFKGFGASSR